MQLTEKELKKYKIGDKERVPQKDSKLHIVAPWGNFKLCWIPYELVDKQIY